MHFNGFSWYSILDRTEGDRYILVIIILQQYTYSFLKSLEIMNKKGFRGAKLLKIFLQISWKFPQGWHIFANIGGLAISRLILYFESF